MGGEMAHAASNAESSEPAPDTGQRMVTRMTQNQPALAQHLRISWDI
jgi:hypothetical protein